MRKILLNKSISKESVNETNILPISLNREVSLLNDEILTDTIDTIEVYNKEKDNSTKHRFIFTLYPICTNVLYNKITEIVKNEGSDSCDVLTNTTKDDMPTRLDAIRNTEYSNSVHNYTYHCGVDIFNNHLLRKKEDIYVQNYSISKTQPFKPVNFNTIQDVYRSVNFSNGEYKYKPIKTIVPNTKDYCYNLKTPTIKDLPIYLYDTVKSFADAYNTNLKYNNGYIGFNNPSTIPIKVNNPINKSETYYINKCINNAEPCQFIDLTPERDLFYFTPKVNTFRRRLEYNWDYCLTYPYKNIYDGIFLDSNVNGLPLINFDNINILYKKQYGSNGLITLLFRCACKHNLNIRDNIKLKFIGDSYKNNKKESFYKEINCNVVNIGENGKNKDYYFSVLANDVKSVINIEDNIFEKDDIISEKGVDIKITQIRFSKIVSGYECEYYFRRFKEIESEDSETNKKYKLKNTLNKLAFSNTIYGDDISQLIYTDDINIEDLKDNRGRPLTEIYLTIIKKNNGYKEWYINENYGDNNVEYSHVFGKVTSGLDLPEFVKKNNINFPTIRGQHNIIEEDVNVYVDESCGKLEDDLIYNKKNDNFFYGDLVEFNPIKLNETVIEGVKHRFNTAQRETKQSVDFNTIYHDEIISDFYDYNDKSNTNYTTNIETKEYHSGYANLAPEGYIYNPHYKIKIGEYDDIVKQASDIKMLIEKCRIIDAFDGSNNEYLEIYTNENYGILPGDLISYYEKSNSGNLKKYRVLHYYVNENKQFIFICGSINNQDLKLIYSKSADLEIKDVHPSQILYFNSTYKDASNNGIEKLLIENNFLKYIIFTKDKNNVLYHIMPNIGYGNNPFDISDKVFFQHNLEIPEYAYMLPDGTGRHLWREIKKPSTYMFNSDLYNIPFTNGAFYHHTNILFTVKRQDPHGEYGMYLRKSKGGPKIDNSFEISSDKFDISSDEYITEIDTTCF